MTDIENLISIINSILKEGLLFKLQFRGNSMYPTICDNSVVLIRKYDELQIGKIYVYLDTFSPTTRLVCHRLNKIDKDKLYFKGDNRESFDFPVDIDKVIGEVIFHR